MIETNGVCSILLAGALIKILKRQRTQTPTTQTPTTQSSQLQSDFQWVL